MKDFITWLHEMQLDERGARTCLGIYPSLYGSQARPPSAHLAVSGGALQQLKSNHPDVLKNTNPPPKKKKKKHKKKKHK